MGEIVRNLLVIGILLLAQSTQNINQLYDVIHHVIPPTNSKDLFQQIRDRYVDPPAQADLSLKLTKNELQRVYENGMGSNRCVTCNYHGEDPNQY